MSISANADERDIRAFKDHFLSVLAGVDTRFPGYLWYTLLPHAELTLNLQRQSMLNLRISEWGYLPGPFDYNATPLVPMGSKIVTHNNPGNHNSWDQRSCDGFNSDPALKHYRCFLVIDAKTKSIIISDTVEFMHSYIT